MATAEPQPDGPSEAFSGNVTDDYDPDGEENEESRMESSNAMSSSTRDRDKKIGHRRVDKSGIVSYKKKPTSELMAAIQLGIGQSVGGLSSKPERDMLMQDFGVVEVVFFPGEGSNLTPAHHYSDFRFKTYAPVAFRYFRHLFGIQPDDFMLSLCDEHLKELSNPGASGSIFYLTYDDEFIIKTVQHKEAEFLQKLLPGYFLNISQNKRTLLPKFYGLYCYQCGGKNIRFTVMNNLLPSTVKLHEKYDMKGSTYKRKASKHERAKKSPTLKDLDFMENHPEGLSMEKDTYDALIKTLQRDTRVLESFKIMDYSLLMGIYNLDLANKEKQTAETSEGEHSPNQEQGYTPNIDMSTQGHSGLQRGKSFKTRIGQYSTPMESIQGNRELTEDLDEDEDVPPGGIPARNAKGERLLIYLGIIDILQSFRLKKRLEHTVKSMVIDGDTISVHRPSYYAQRFLQFHATRVFKKAQPGSTALKHSPSKKRSQVKTRSAPASDGSEGIPGSGQHGRSERGGRTISFSDEAQSGASGAVGGRPDLLPEHSHMRNSGSRNRTPSPRLGAGNVNGNSRHQKRYVKNPNRKPSRSEAFNMTTYPSDDGLSSSSLRGLSSPGGRGGASPPLSLSESTPTHTDFTEGTPSFTNSSPSCSSEAMVTSTPARSSARFRRVSFEDGETRTLPLRPAIRSFSPSSPSSGHGSGEGHSVRFSSDVQQQQQEHTTTTTTTTTNSSATTITTGTAAAVVAEAVYDMGSSNPLDSAGLDDTPQHRGHHHYTQRSPDMRHRGNRVREAVTSSSPSLHQHQQLQQQQQQQSSVTTVKTEVVEYVESSVTVKVTPESPSPSLATPVHFSMPPAVKDSPDATGQGSNMSRGEPQEVTSPVAAVSGAGGDLQAEEEGLTATASEMTRL